MSETIQQLKEDIALLQMKLQKLEETQMTLEKSGEFSIVSYNGETYYRNLYDGICGGWYKTDTDGEVFYLVEDETERKLEKLYQEQVADNPYCPDEPEHYDEVEWDEKDNPKPMDDVVNRLVKKYQAQKLWNRVRDELGYSIDLCDEIVDLVEKWLPEEQSAAGSQNVDTELLVDGHNHCLQKMKEMLR
jgi:hypothetical protein